jgi:hypothetical protein
VFGQGLADQPVKDTVPARLVGEDVPALVPRWRNPRRDHRYTESIDEDGLEGSRWLVGHHRISTRATLLESREFKAPPERITRAVEQPQSQVPVRRGDVWRDHGTGTRRKPPAANSGELPVEVDG